MGIGPPAFWLLDEGSISWANRSPFMTKIHSAVFVFSSDARWMCTSRQEWSEQKKKKKHIQGEPLILLSTPLLEFMSESDIWSDMGRQEEVQKDQRRNKQHGTGGWTWEQIAFLSHRLSGLTRILMRNHTRTKYRTEEQLRIQLMRAGLTFLDSIVQSIGLIFNLHCFLDDSRLIFNRVSVMDTL